MCTCVTYMYLRVMHRVLMCEGKPAYLGVIVSVCEGKLAYNGVIVLAHEGKLAYLGGHSIGT